MYAIKHLPGLVAYYPLNETQGTISANYAPTAQGAAQGQNTNIIMSQPGTIGRSDNFQGSTALGQVNLGTTSAMNLPGTLTMFSFIYPTAGTDATHTDIISNRFNFSGTSGYLLKIGTVGVGTTVLRGYMGNVSHISLGTIKQSSWQYVGANIYGTSLDFYINGALDTTANYAITVTNNNNNLSFIGNESLGGGFTFTGNLQHAAYLNGTLTPNQWRKIGHLGGFI